MKLLELSRSYYPSVGGFEKSIRDKTKIYDALGIDYKIVTTDFNLASNTGSRRISDIVYMKQYTPYNITPALYKHIQGDYDVVNINLIGRFYSDAAIQYFSGTKTKIILTPHSFYHADRYKSIKRFMQKIVFPYLLKKIDMLVSITEYEKSTWISQYDVPANRIVVVPHYIASNDIQGKKEPLGKSKKYLLYLGRNDINKRPDLLLRSFLQLKDVGYSLYLTLKESDVDPALREAVINDKRIQLFGYVSDDLKLGLIQQADAVVVPTIWEAFGYVAFEASQYAKPLLCSNIPVFRELLSERGVLYFENTESSLTEVLGKFFLMNDNEKKNMGNANYRNISLYTFEKSKEKYRLLFERLFTS